MAGGAKGGGGTPQNQAMGKGMGGTPQNQAMGSMGKGSGGMPQGQAMGATPQQIAQKYAEAQASMSNVPAGVGDPRSADMMANRQRMMDQYRTAMTARPGLGGGIGGMMGMKPPPNYADMAGVNKADFMPGGALAAPLELGGNPNPGGATPATAPAQPQMAAEAMNRLQSQAGPQAGIASMSNMYGGKGGGGFRRSGGYGFGRMSGMPGYGQQAMNNGGIVGLAGGGKVWEPVSRGGVSYAPTAPAAPMATAPAAAAAAAAPAAKVAWSPVAPAATGSSGMFNNVSVAPVAQPAAWSGPTTPQTIWQPPAKAEAPAKGAGMDPKIYNKMRLANMLGIPMKNPQAAYDQMSDRQYIDWKTSPLTKGSRQMSGGRF